MKIAAFIPARLASTRLTNKLILPLGEHSVIATTYLQVLQTKLFSEVVCITDSIEIESQINAIKGKVFLKILVNVFPLNCFLYLIFTGIYFIN